MRKPPVAAIFDLDGVLLDTEPQYTQATQSIVAQFGKTYSWDLKRRVMGGTAESGADVIVKGLDLPMAPAEYLAQRRVLLEQLFELTVPIEGAEALVQTLFERGLRLGIATSSERALFELKTRHHAWFSRFSAKVCGDDPRLVRPKPAPDIFLLAAKDLGIDIQSCIVFEDSPAGVVAAAASGAWVVARRDPALYIEEIAAANCIVERYAELDVGTWFDSGLP